MVKERSIAVLPFICLSSHDSDGFFCDGLTEEIINALAKIDNVYVTSRTSSFFFKDKQVDVKEIAQKLGVRYVVEGSTRRSNNQIRITVQLINAEEDYHYFSENFDYDFTNIFEIQDDIGRIVKEKFRELIGHFDIDEALPNENPRSLEAYEMIIRAKQVATDLSNNGVRLGLELIENAILLEPNNPSYLSTKATYLTALGIMCAWPMDKVIELAIDASNKALAIDPDNPEAHAIIGYLSFALKGDLAKFHRHINHSLNSSPNNPVTQYFVSVVASAEGKEEIGMRAIEIAFKVNPLSQMPYYFNIINLTRFRRFTEAMAAAESFLKDFPEHINVYNVKGLILLRTGRFEEALAHFKTMPNSKGPAQPYYGGMALAEAYLGHNDKALEYLDLAIENDESLHLSYRENPRVVVNIVLGNLDEAFQYLEADIERGAWYTRFYKTNPVFDKILGDPRADFLEQALIEDEHIEPFDKAKYAKSGLKPSEIRSIETQLINYLEEKKPYLDQNLSLKKLAEDLAINPNHLSQVINSQKNKNFFDLINSYRIKELVEMLKNPENKKFTILALAYEAGFNSKSTFNASFKKLTGFTPSEYLKSVEVA